MSKVFDLTVWIKTTLCAAIFGMTMLAAPSASALETVILVVDKIEVLNQSNAGKSIATQIDELRGQFKVKFDEAKSEIDKEAQEFQSKAGDMDEAKEQEKAREIIGKRQGYNAQSNLRKQELELTKNNAYGELAKSMDPILEQIAKERKATILVDKSALITFDNAIDITDEAVKRLDKKVPTYEVTYLMFQAPQGQPAQ